MPWSSNAPQLGFSTAEPWLPVGADHGDLAVDRQSRRDGSLLQFTRDCLKLRNAHPALRQGSMTVERADDQLLVFERAAPGSRIRCTFNLSDRPAGHSASGTQIAVVGDLDGTVLGPYSGVIEEIA